MKENNHNIRVVYLLNGIDKNFHLNEIFLACLKINMKHSKNIDVVETCQLRSVTPQCTKWLFPTAAMCVKTVSSNETFGYIGCQEKMLALVGRNFSRVDILLTFTLCQCNVMTLLDNLSGSGAWCRIPVSNNNLN